jgi:hypothetical protein
MCAVVLFKKGIDKLWNLCVALASFASLFGTHMIMDMKHANIKDLIRMLKNGSNICVAKRGINFFGFAKRVIV